MPANQWDLNKEDLIQSGDLTAETARAEAAESSEVTRATAAEALKLAAANNLSDLASAASARTNLGLGSAAVQTNSFFAQVANNLSDLGSRSSSRTNLGIPGNIFNVMDPTYGAAGNGTTDDTAAINGAISAFNSNGGGILYFPKGSSYYKTSGGHALTAPGVVMGQGYGTIGVGTNGTSILYLANGSNADMFTLGAHAITFLDIGLYGNIGNQTATSRGVVTSASLAANYARFMRVWIDSFHDDGIYLQGPGSSLEALFYLLKLTSNGAHGVNVSGGSAADCHFSNCVVNSNVLSGAYVNAANTVFDTCHIWGNGSNTAPPTSGDVGGIFMPSGAAGYLRVTNSYIESNGNATAGGRGVQSRGQGNQIASSIIYNNRANGIYAFSNTGLNVTGCVFRNNNLNAASGAAGAGIEYDTCTASSVTSCYMFDTQGTKTQTYGYAENGNTCNACLFSGNVSRAADNKTGNWLIGTGNPTATIPATPASYNVG
jgi:hypothetical protein